MSALARQDLGAKAIRHSHTLSDLVVTSIAGLPTALQSKKLFAKLCGSGPDEEFAQACWTLRRLSKLGQQDVTDRVLRSSASIEAMSDAVAALPFPEPPWPGTGRLRPVVSVDALRRTGARLRNCLRAQAGDYAIEVVRGSKFFFEWFGDEPAIIAVDSLPPLGWVVKGGESRDNDPIGPSTWRKIKAELVSWTDLAPLWVSPEGDPLCIRFFKTRLSR